MQNTGRFTHTHALTHTHTCTCTLSKGPFLLGSYHHLTLHSRDLCASSLLLYPRLLPLLRSNAWTRETKEPSRSSIPSSLLSWLNWILAIPKYTAFPRPLGMVAVTSLIAPHSHRQDVSRYFLYPHCFFQNITYPFWCKVPLLL